MLGRRRRQQSSLAKVDDSSDEAAESGFKGIELGPYGYISLTYPLSKKHLNRGLTLTAGTIFDDLVSASNYDNLIDQAHKICDFIRQMPEADVLPKQKFRRLSLPSWITSMPNVA